MAHRNNCTNGPHGLRRSRRRTCDALNSNSEEFNAQTFEDDSTKPPSPKLKKNGETRNIIDETDCPICFCELTNKIGTPDICNHNFCFQCLMSWASLQNTCPIDRKKFSNIFIRRSCDAPVSDIQQVDNTANNLFNGTQTVLQLGQDIMANIPQGSQDLNNLEENQLEEDFGESREIIYEEILTADASIPSQSNVNETIDDESSVSDILCAVCQLGDREERMLLCDKCDDRVGYHLECLDPPLNAVPRFNWFCPQCVNSARRYPNRARNARQTRGRGANRRRRN